MVRTMPISPAQFRAARDLSELSDEQLAEQSGVSMRTVLAFQAGEAIPSLDARTIQRVFENHGVVFTRTGVGFGPPVAWSPSVLR